MNLVWKLKRKNNLNKKFHFDDYLKHFPREKLNSSGFELDIKVDNDIDDSDNYTIEDEVAFLENDNMFLISDLEEPFEWDEDGKIKNYEVLIFDFKDFNIYCGSIKKYGVNDGCQIELYDDYLYVIDWFITYLELFLVFIWFYILRQYIYKLFLDTSIVYIFLLIKYIFLVIHFCLQIFHMHPIVFSTMLHHCIVIFLSPLFYIISCIF